MYLKNGYLDFNYILKKKMIFNFIIGGRGIGKTYGALKYMIEKKKKFILMRRTQSQIDLITNDEFSPFKKLNTDLNLNISMKKNTKYSSLITDDENILGYALALSTISNLRGFDASDVDYIIFDEFIPESHERLIKNEDFAFFNAYETINRNRELEGKKPLISILLSNSNNFFNPLFVSLDLISVVDKLTKLGREEYINSDKGIALFNITHSGISQKKEKTALYKISGDNEFKKMSLENSYNNYDTSDIKSQKLIEYKLICGVGDIFFYKHKNNGTIYISEHRSGNLDYYYHTDSISLNRFRKKFGMMLYNKFLASLIYFENQLTKAKFLNIIK